MKTIEHTNALAEARALEVPSRELSLRRDPSVSQFWNENRKLLKASWAEWEIENKDDLLVPDETLLDPRLRKLLKRLGKIRKKNLLLPIYGKKLYLVFM